MGVKEKKNIYEASVKFANITCHQCSLDEAQSYPEHFWFSDKAGKPCDTAPPNSIQDNSTQTYPVYSLTFPVISYLLLIKPFSNLKQIYILFIFI